MLIFLYFNFSRLVIEIFRERLTLRFGLFKKVIKKEDIVKSEQYELKFREFGGYGVRYGMGTGNHAWNTRLGPGVRLQLKNKKNGFVFNTDHPDKICRFLKS
jgi:hypothetical protein